jgi:transposase
MLDSPVKPGNDGKSASRSYPNEFKQEAVKLAFESISVSSVAKDLGIPDATLHTWVKKAKQSGKYISAPDGVRGNLNINDVLEKNKELKKKLSRLEQEKAILKKAATYFARELG